ncbi:transcriptional regulator [Longispora fulva]|uniref:Helix-turn-helix protein n=1 Tax=Longispora fulva TaxID=619741 RepID=A0A8J7GS73_9ACTN|nr:helix-turn-helix transcriptional regulator [Longispora fulva]MBG6136051.1 hypothetical protein [Longispora fulva]GIG55707.1 transcriptional regulator [Longispora fulva]
MADPKEVRDARKALGQTLAAYRNAAGHTQTTLAPLTNYVRSTIANVETGRQNVPRDFWEACDRLLDTGGTLAAGFDNLQGMIRAAHRPTCALSDRGEQPEPARPDSPDRGMVDPSVRVWSADTVEGVNRAEFLRTALGVGAGLVATTATPVPRMVGQAEIDQVHASTSVFAGWDNQFGGGLARETVVAQLNWSMKLLHATIAPAVRPDLFAAVAGLSAVAGFMAFDGLAHDDARRMFGFGLACSEESGDWRLRAGLLAAMARREIWCGNPDQGLTYAETAAVRSDRLTATIRAELSTIRARALAKLGPSRAQDALAAVGEADEHYAAVKRPEDPVWTAYYDDAQHAGDTAHALVDLQITGHHTDAAQRLDTAVAGHTAAYARSKAMSAATLATLTLGTADRDEGIAQARVALQAARPLRSQRVTTGLRDLERALRRATNDQPPEDLVAGLSFALAGR